MSQFCACHDTRAAVACAKSWCNCIIETKIRMKRIFKIFQSRVQNLFTRWWRNIRQWFQIEFLWLLHWCPNKMAVILPSLSNLVLSSIINWIDRNYSEVYSLGSDWSIFYQHRLTLIWAWISNYIHHMVWDEIAYPFTNFNGATVEVWEWMSHFIPHFTEHKVTFPSLD